LSRRPAAVALTVAGSDSSGGAGVQADLKTFGAIGVWGLSAVTAVTAQNSGGVAAVHLLPGSMVKAQIDAVVADTTPGAVKTGMLATREIVEAVAAAIADGHLAPLVVDPVLAASQGGRLLDPDGLTVMKELLLPMCAVLTPNLPEAELLLGRSVSEVEQMPDAAAALSEYGPRAVLLKGGHLRGDRSPDLLWRDGQATWLDGPRIVTAATHGTGCTLSAALTGYLATGLPLLEACKKAKAFVTAAIAGGIQLGPGPGCVDALWNWGKPS
jgi:hydroxymethylpyrimidine/phosphomethylpyrimidine kinase